MGVDPVSLAINAALIAANMALTASQSFEGPRLTDLSVTTADYGTALSYVYGTRVIEGTLCIWAEPLREVKQQNKTKGGKYNEFKYYGTWATLVCDQPADAVTRIWFDEHLVYDATGAGPISPFSIGGSGSILDYLRIYLGAADQLPDPRIQATTDADLGAGSTPAYRGCTYIMFEELPLEKLGNRLPQVAVEVVTNGGAAYPYEQVAALGSPFRLFGFSYSADRSLAFWSDANDLYRYTIWDVAARRSIVAGLLDDSFGSSRLDEGAALASDGLYYTTNSDHLVRVPGDGVGPATSVADIPLYAGGAKLVSTLIDGLPQEWVGIISAANAFDTTIAYFDVTAQALHTVNSVDYISGSISPSDYFVDPEGDLWVCGKLNSTTLGLLQLTHGRTPIVSRWAEVTVPAVSSMRVQGFCYADAAHDHFVIQSGEAGIAIVDRATLSMTVWENSIPASTYDGWAQFRNIAPNAPTFWLNNAEISSVDLSVVRTVNYGDWLTSSFGGIYDPINHAILTGESTLLGFNDTVTLRYLDRLTGQGVTLQSIVEDVGSRAGLVAGTDFDASALDQSIAGYSWTQGTGKAILEPLLEAYDSEARPHDFELEFRKRGSASQGLIAVGQMGAGGGKRYTVSRTLDSDLPLRVDVTHADPALDQQPNTQHAKRAAASVDSARVQSLDLTTLVLTPDEAKPKAEGYLRRLWYGAESYDNSLTRAWSKLEPADVWTLDLDGEQKTAKLNKLEFGANGVLTCSWTRDLAKIHDTSSLAGATGDGYVPPVILSPGYTRGLVLDIPLATDADDGIIAYVVAGPYNPTTTWPGATVYESTDGVSYSDAFATLTASQEGTFGYANAALADALTSVWDRVSTVSVQMQAGALTSTSEAAVEAGANLALIGDELVGFATATLTATDTYTLSTLLRGRRGTEQHTGDHVSGERFVLLTGNRVRAALGASDVGDTLYFKPVTAIGGTGFVQALTYTAASAKPYSPVHLSAADVAGDTVISWTRRTRIGGEALNGTTPPLGETTEAYEVDILNGSNAVIRTLSGLTSPSATYTAAQISADSGAGVTAKVYQISSTVGRGFPASVAL